MKLGLLHLALTLISPVPTDSTGADRYDLDREGNQVSFAVRYVRITQVEGVFDEISGSLAYDAEQKEPTALELVIQARSLNTGDLAQDRMVAGPLFLNVARYPTIRFSSQEIVRSESGYLAVGLLTLRNVVHPIEIPLEVSGPRQFGRGPTWIRLNASFRMAGRDLRDLVERLAPGARLLPGTDVSIELKLRATKSD